MTTPPAGQTDDAPMTAERTPTMTDSATPRTDAEEVDLTIAIKIERLPSGRNQYVKKYVTATFARQLERQLAAAHDEAMEEAAGIAERYLGANNDQIASAIRAAKGGK